MNTPIAKRQQIIEEIDTLPEDALSELVSFIEYLRHKSVEQKSAAPQPNFLLSIAGLGTSGETTVSERDEAILANEIDPLHGWSLHRKQQG
ncbi:MAG: DUF2281 domain-containing protein [Tildeniella nuda ZEHNDER 1965/U140]|jgi:hypothetical protein|nr:DUF2281 domain-containing protein [Tildeniella nuda ZEHNDER 1965/U140]